jgi:small subunit ribosomal protein S18
MAKYYEDRHKKVKQLSLQKLSIKLPKQTEKEKDPIELATESTCDMPIRNLKNPYEKEMHQCIFCKYNIQLDYKNVQLLSQFVSPQTGLVYRQEITGLCHYKYKELEKTIWKARRSCLMPYYHKEKIYINDPSLFDPFKDNLKKIEDSYDPRKIE